MDFQIIVDAIPEILTQLIAFLLVFFILKKYAFGAVFKMLEERQKTIADSVKDAEKKREELDLLKKDYEAKLQGIEQEARQKIQAAIQEGQKIAGEIRVKAQEDAAQQMEKAKADIGREVDKAKATLRNQVAELSTQIAGKLIEKNLSQKDNEKFIDEVLSKAGDLS